MRRATKVGLVVALLLVLPACAQPTPTFRGEVLDTPVPAPDFTLTDQFGQPFRLSDQRGYVVLLFFGYTYCPDVCPTTLGVWKRVHDELGEDAQRVRFVFVTVDPDRDTPERLREYLPIFNPDFVGLTGTLEELTPVYQAYGVYREVVPLEDSALGYQVTHTSSEYVIGADGYWRLLHSFGTPAEDIVHDLRLLLQ